MSTSYVVTGGAGFIGTNLVTWLVQNGDSVKVIDDLSAGDETRLPAKAIFVKGCVTDTELLKKECVGADVVVHLAAIPKVQFTIEEPARAHEVNVNGLLSVLEAVRATNVPRIVFASSSAVYGDLETMPLSEDMPTDPKSPYALHKLVGEQYLKLWNKLYGIETVSLRFFNVYGPHLDPEGAYALVIGRFLLLAQERKPLTVTGNGTQTRDFIHVSDIVQAIVLAATSAEVGNGGVMNVGSGYSTTINDLATMFGDEVEYVPPRIEPHHSQADVSKLKQLNWRPRVSLKDGIEEIKKEFKL